MTMPELGKVCKGQVSRWPSKKEVKALIASANHGRTDHPPIVVVRSDEAAVNNVESTPGGIGLVNVYSICGEVTVLRAGGKLPL
jgi:hypothetical protein